MAIYLVFNSPVNVKAYKTVKWTFILQKLIKDKKST